MKHTSNEERLKILQERLSQINDKKHHTEINKSAEEKIQQESMKENTEQINSSMSNENVKQNKSSSLGKYFLTIIGIALLAFFIYPQILLISEPTNKETDNNETSNEVVDEKIKYNLNITGNIAVIDVSDDENIAKAMINALQVKGFKCDYFYLPEKSNSKEEIYKIYIGPYDNPNEMRQWINNIETEVEIINL